jgi:hypothetical protein
MFISMEGTLDWLGKDFEVSKAGQPLTLSSKSKMTPASPREKSTGKYNIGEGIVSRRGKKIPLMANRRGMR